jgi:hypothetical protein
MDNKRSSAARWQAFQIESPFARPIPQGAMTSLQFDAISALFSVALSFFQFLLGNIRGVRYSKV